MKRWCIIRHIRWFYLQWQYARWWKSVGQDHWLFMHPKDEAYLSAVWDGEE